MILKKEIGRFKLLFQKNFGKKKGHIKFSVLPPLHFSSGEK